LTMLLQHCIGGNSRTVMFACIAPNNVPIECNTHESNSTLQFASRAKVVRNGLTTVTGMQLVKASEVAAERPDNEGDYYGELEEGVESYGDHSSQAPAHRVPNRIPPHPAPAQVGSVVPSTPGRLAPKGSAAGLGSGSFSTVPNQQRSPSTGAKRWK
jgi:hypothetical protein